MAVGAPGSERTNQNVDTNILREKGSQSTNLLHRGLLEPTSFGGEENRRNEVATHKLLPCSHNYCLEHAQECLQRGSCAICRQAPHFQQPLLNLADFSPAERRYLPLELLPAPLARSRLHPRVRRDGRLDLSERPSPARCC